MGFNASLRASSRTLKLLLISSIFGSSWQKTPSIRPSIRKRYPSLSSRQLAGTSALYRGSAFALFFCTRTWISWPSAAARPYPECASMLPLRGTGNAKSDSAILIDFFTTRLCMSKKNHFSEILFIIYSLALESAPTRPGKSLETRLLTSAYP